MIIPRDGDWRDCQLDLRVTDVDLLDHDWDAIFEKIGDARALVLVTSNDEFAQWLSRRLPDVYIHYYAPNNRNR